MKIGVRLPHTGPFASPDAIRRVAVLAEDLGYDSLWVRDSLTRNREDVRAHFTAGSVEAWDRVEEPIEPNLFESVTTLAYVAGLTKHVRLGTAVLLPPLRHPVWLAKYFATMDQLSGGRMILGIGTGSPPYAKAELAALGRPELLGRRGRLVDEWITIMRSVWQDDVTSFDGEFITVEGAQVFPKPVQCPLPILYGGTGERVMRRIAKRLDGWFPIFLAPDVIAAGRRQLEELAQEHGRQPSELQVVSENWLSVDDDAARAAGRVARIDDALFEHARKMADPTRMTEDHKAYEKMERESLAGPPEAIRELLGRYEEAGVDTLVLRVVADDLDEMLEQLVRFRERV
ncbi:MAG TPA: TIGR03619 family F420-dependent LLM class oxidoreductase [Solirubrobacteraceae bacterium]|nr:TIGR03619 family F420-dependent LLM class oxidoreductase [Solirubrobacteraceae bacterium]